MPSDEDVRRRWWDTADAWELYWGDTGHHLRCLDRLWNVFEPTSPGPAHRFARQWRAWRQRAGESLDARRTGLPTYAADALVFGMYDSIAGPARGREWR